MRVKDLWQKDLHYGKPVISDPDNRGEKIANPNFWKWCKWMLVLHKPWDINPYVSGLWGPESMNMANMTDDEQHQLYEDGWRKFTETPRGKMIQERIDRERADKEAVRERLLNDDEFRTGNWGTKTLNCAGEHNDRI